VDRPDLNTGEVLVLDRDHLDRIPLPIPNPERVVLIASNSQEDLEIAWAAGLQTVVPRKDPINTATLAVLAASLYASGNSFELLPRI
jgi:predicted Zn-dependent peptidase